MMNKAELVERMLGLGPDGDLERLRSLTRRLVDHRASPRMEQSRFEGTIHRGIPGFDRGLVPAVGCIVITGGTGCVGHAVLSRLGVDLPGARLVSVARRPPIPARRVDGVTYVEGDVRDPVRMAFIMRSRRPEMVIHLAAQRRPDYAENHVVETVSTNVLGSSVVLEAAGEAGVGTVVVVSTGKAVRLFTSDIYAATKKVVEYQAAAACTRYGTMVTCARFTHVVDNSIVGTRLGEWIARDQPIRLHSPDVLLPVQSALECYHLLVIAGRVAGSTPKGVALRDLGWPPVDLLDLTLDYLADAPASLSPIVFTGYPAGYEACAYPGTYDPLSAGDVSPLINCLEARRTMATDVLGSFVDQWELTCESSAAVDEAVTALVGACGRATSEAEMRRRLQATSRALLTHRMDGAPPAEVARIHRLGSTYDPAVSDHGLIHRHLTAHLVS